MATKIVVQQVFPTDELSVSKYPKFTIQLATSLAGVTVSELYEAVEDAQTAATNAANSATTAGTRATQAATSATQSANSATTAGTRATQAQGYATNAANSATAAKQSAQDAAAELGLALRKDQNLADLPNKSASRGNLGLGSAATHDAQTSPTDAELNRILKIAANGEGPFGLGSRCLNLDATDVVVQLRSRSNGWYRCPVNTVRAPTTAAWSFLVSQWDSNTRSVLAFNTDSSQGLQFIVIGPSTDTGWRPVWHSGNLTFPLSLEKGGSNKNVGAFANGPNVQDPVPIATFLASADTYGNNSAGSVSINDDGEAWHTYLNIKHRSGNGDGVNYGFMLTDRAMTTNSYSEIGLRKRTPVGWRSFVKLWHSENLEKQTSTMDTAPNRVAITNAYGMGLGGMLPTTLNYADISTSGVTQAFKSPSDGINWPTNNAAWVGQHWAFDNNAGASLAILAAQSAASVRAAVKVRRGGSDHTWMNVLLSNQYTVDANGFYKTASPVINIYSDGSFTTTDEASGVNVERLSEGVYKITGCLGLNSDRAWGGDDGGITNPRCRNGMERIWNDYNVESDGSIIIKTYHRVHKDAPKFASNRLNLDKQPYSAERDGNAEWPDLSLIDIPRDVYLQVRVQMPVEDVPESMYTYHSNVYSNTISPA